MKCKNCGNEAPEDAIFCPKCDSRDFDCAEMTPVTQKNPSPGKELLVSLFERFSKLGFRLQTVIALALAIVFFFLGFAFHSAIGIKKSDFDSLSQKNSELSASVDALNQEKSEQEKEYKEYKEKMQPYEEMQKADAKAKADAEAEKKKAEQKAAQKAEEERKAAEEKKKADEAAAAIAKTLGVTKDDFYRSFNDIASTNGFGAFLGKETLVGEVCKWATTNNAIKFDCMLSGQYVDNVSIYISRDADSATLRDASYYPIVAVTAFDKKCNADTAAGYLHEILENAQKNIGTDCKKTVNGIEYICNVDQSSVFYHFRRAR